MSQRLSVRRRRRDDSEDDLSEASSGSGKRRRGNNFNKLARQYTNDASLDRSGHHPGAIVRVSLANFVTYERADFFPGPSLNMVIGPNGTGKSSLVCAICLGLGWAPTLLGRAEDYMSFIKHGKKDATIEIELKGKSDEHPNHIVKVQIMKDPSKDGSKDDSKRKWWINGKDATLNKVKDLTRELSIQIDNLCQFLPQDKVSEFAAMTPKELLHSTQRAAAPPEMLAYHDQLIALRKKQKELQLKHDTNIASLESNQKKKDGLQDDVDKLQDRANAEKKIELLKKCRPFIEYKTRRTEFQNLKERKKDASTQLKRLQAQTTPALQAVNEKQEYRRQIEAVEKERTQSIKSAERALAAIVQERREIEEKIKQIGDARQSELAADTKRKQAKAQSQRKISDLKAKLQQPPDFDAADWNRRIKEERNNGKTLDNQINEFKGRHAALKDEGGSIRKTMDDTKNRLAALNSQAGRQFDRLANQSPDTAKGWEWIQEHQEEFEKTVYGPALVECKIKEGCEQYLDSVESVISRDVILSFTAQTRNDYLKLIHVFRDTLGLSETYIKTSLQPITAYQPPLNEQQARQFGLDGFVLDFIDGPDPVLAMLCGTSKLHTTGITLRSHSEAQHNQLIAENSPISSWIAGKSSFRVIRRREYGPGAVSTSAQNVKPAKWWTEHSVDTSAIQELENRIKEYTLQWEEKKKENNELKELLSKAQSEKLACDERREELERNKNELQKEDNLYRTLPTKIEREEEIVAQKELDGLQSRDKIQNLVLERNEAGLNRATLAFKYKDQFVKLHQAQEQHMEVEARLLEATSDFEALEERNSHIVEQLNQAETLYNQITADTEEAKQKALKMLDIIKEIQAEVDEEELQFLNNLPVTLDDAELAMQISTEKAILESNFASNPNARKDYEKYQQNIARLEAQIEESTSTLESYAIDIAKVRENWEPALDDLVSNISDAFSYNFQQIGCAGEVSVHKDDGFDNWSLEIKVKFRDGEGESLQILDAHRQSGGERSVSTIFFLMSLQSMAQAPFRVVDEINQGMDPRNERVVHERMVDIACKEHTSQYFLITPKLLTGLKYDPRMRVLCIASGEYMPQNHETVSVKKAIAIKRALIAAG